jgi:hypothetical protein
MNLPQILPPEVVLWLIRYGIVSAVSFFLVMGLALLLRPFWLWYTGRSATLDRLKRLEESGRKTLMELEVLNQTLSIPVRKAAQRAKAEEKAAEPLVVTQEAKDAFLKALEKTRARLADEKKPDSEDDSPPSLP